MSAGGTGRRARFGTHDAAFVTARIRSSGGSLTGTASQTRRCRRRASWSVRSSSGGRVSRQRLPVDRKGAIAASVSATRLSRAGGQNRRLLVAMNVPTQVRLECLLHGRRGLREAHHDVVLEAVSAHVLEKSLKPRDFDDAVGAEGANRVVREPSFTEIRLDLP